MENDKKTIDYCQHPIKVEDSSEKGYYYKRCGARSKLFCEYCSNAYTRDKNIIISSGCEVSSYDETITQDMIDEHVFYGLTMTAPSFGSVYSIMDAIEPSLEDLIGTPKRFGAYKFNEHILWNANSSELFHHSMKYLRASFKKDFEYVVVREWQARGVIHYHAMFRVKKEDSKGFLEKVKKFKSYKYKKDGNVYKWGQQSYVEKLGKHTLTATVSYFSKALSEDVRQHGFEYKILPDRIRKYYDKLDYTAYQLLCKCQKSFTECSCKFVRNFGFTGHLISPSKNWSFSGLNQTVLKQKRKEWVEANKDKMEENTENSDYMEEIYTKNIISYSSIVGNKKTAEERIDNLLKNYSHIFAAA